MKQNYIFRLEIPIDNVQVMQIFKCEDYLRGIEAGVLLGVSARFAQMREHFAAGHILQYHVQVGGVLEAECKLHHERKVDRAQYFALIERMLDLFHFDNVLLLEHLHGIPLAPVAFHVHNHDASEAARADRAVQLKVIELHIHFLRVDEAQRRLACALKLVLKLFLLYVKVLPHVRLIDELLISAVVVVVVWIIVVGVGTAVWIAVVVGGVFRID